MIILNPIYDTAFKYLMEDVDTATDILEVILKEKIHSLDVLPQEVTTEDDQNVRILRFDFKAVIQNQNNELKTVLVEIQKAKKEREYDTLRFRRYLGKNYETEENIVNAEGIQEKMTLPIISVYFLGFRLKNVQAPIVKVERVYRNLTSGKIIKSKKKEPFIEKLSHDLYAIQIPRLKMQTKTEVEKVLDVFSQVKYKTNDRKISDFTGDTSNPRVQRVVTRLNRATLYQEMLERMKAEEDIENEFEAMDKQIERLRKEVSDKTAVLAKINEEKNQVYKEKKQVFKEKERAFKEKEQAFKEKEQAFKEKEQAVEEKKQAFKEKEQAVEEKKQTEAALESVNNQLAELQKQMAFLMEQLNQKNEN